MSQSPADWSPQDKKAASAIVSHHAQLSAGLNQRAEALLTLTEQAERARAELVAYLRAEVVPHARAEEKALYPAAAAQPAGALLVNGMLGEHAVLLALVDELAAAPSTVRAAASARAIAALFAAHLSKENDLVVPLIAGTPDVSLADLLDGMHDLLGGADEHAHGDSAGGCGCGGCACGEDAGPADAPAELLSIDPRVDVRTIPHRERHATVFSALDRLAPGQALLLVADHAPMPLLAQIDVRYGGQFTVDWLQSGPEVFQLRLQRDPVRV